MLSITSFALTPFRYNAPRPSRADKLKALEALRMRVQAADEFRKTFRPQVEGLITQLKGRCGEVREARSAVSVHTMDTPFSIPPAESAALECKALEEGQCDTIGRDDARKVVAQPEKGSTDRRSPYFWSLRQS